MADETKDPKTDFTGMNLKQKVVAIRKEMHNIEKTGHNEHFNYDFVEAGVLMGKIGSRLAEAGVIIGRRNLTASRSMEERGAIVSLQCEYGLIDAESTEELWYASYGEGQDKSDKAAYKAWTGMFKYFLMQAFALAMGDDPEAEDVGTDTPTTGKTPQNGSNREPRASTGGMEEAIASARKSLRQKAARILGSDERGLAWLKEKGITNKTMDLKVLADASLELNKQFGSMPQDETTTAEDDISW